MLSNTATPKYYGMFRESVLKGEIPVCETVSMQMNLIDDLIADPRYYYDDKAIDGFIKFCENEMTLTDGGDLELLPTFKLWAEDLLAWFYFVDINVFVPGTGDEPGHYEIRRVKKRLRSKQYLLLPRGAAKSIYLSLLQSYFLICDRSTTYQITIAPTMKQAEEVMNPIKTAIIRSRGPVFKMLTEGSIFNTTGPKANRVKLTPTKKGIENFITGSLIEVRPMSIDKLQGLRCKVATVDEWLSGDVKEDVIGAIEQGASKIRDYIIICASSEGTVRNGVGDTIKMELMSILKREYMNPHVSIWYYKLDNLKEVGDPNTWIKANPNLGRTVSYETYMLDVERAEKAPQAKNDILAKRFNLPMEGFTYSFKYEDTLPHPPCSFNGMRCSLGCDLSRGDDFCAFTFLFPLKDGSFGVKARSYISSVNLLKLEPAARRKYDEFVKEGTLAIFEGVNIDMQKVYDDLIKFIDQHNYDVCCVGYDPYNAAEFINLWTSENGNFGVDKVIQGRKTESVPLGEISNLASERLLIFDESIMTYTMGNSVTMEDINGNRMLAKNRRNQKIDNVSALLDAYVQYKLNKEAFY